MILYHATRTANLPSILAQGLLTSHYGKVHGEMEYAPAGPSVYLSRHENSSNLNSDLFRTEDESENAPVSVLMIDADQLDPDLFRPDDSFFYILDEEYLESWEDIDDGEKAGLVREFSTRYSISEDSALDLLTRCAEEGEAEYSAILAPIWREILAVEGEVSYLGDVPASAIIEISPYEAPEEVDPAP